MADVQHRSSYSYKMENRDRDGGAYNNSDGKYPKESKYDDPPNSRLFIVCGKSITEEDFRESFSRFGTIDEIWVVKDRNSGEPKGVTYIKFSKTSEAALAMEEMNGRCIGSHPRPLKVLIAHSRDQGSRRETNEEERLLRLFVVVPKTMTEMELRERFQEYGDIDYVSIVRDRNTKESKGFGYVKYHRMSHSSKAYENCDRSFKPMFADPKPPRPEYRQDMYSGPGSSASSAGPGAYDMGTYDGAGANTDGGSRLCVIASAVVNQDQLWRLFDLVPGLDYIDLRRERKAGPAKGVAAVVYNNPQSAAYAKEKLHGFEYPPGQRLIVKYEGGGHDVSMAHGHHPQMAAGANYHNMGRMPAAMNQASAPHRPPAPNLQNDLAQLAETIAQATSLIQAAGIRPNIPQGVAQVPSVNSTPAPPAPALIGSPEIYDPSYCSVKLPPPQPLAPVDSALAERLFIVCHPSPPPVYALKDAFGRFGNLIDVYMLNGKTCGYAKYASKESADKAVLTLHGQELLGARLKVMPADPHDKSDSGRKRIRIDDQ